MPRGQRALIDAEEAIIMAELGSSAKYIGSECGLSAGQVYYRLRLVGVRIKDYRDGKSHIAKLVHSAVKSKVKRIAETRIARALPARTP